MKKHVIAASLIIVLVAILFFIVEHGTLGSSEIDDKYIHVNKVNGKIIVVGLGYDAVTAFNTEDGIVMIDAGISNTLTQKYREAIQKEFGNSNFKYLINTHAHSDHTGGNQVFADAVIVAHQNCLIEMKEFENNIENAKPRLLKIVQDYEKELSEITPGTEEWKETYCQIIRYELTYNDLNNNRVVTYPSLTFDDQEHISTGTMNFDLCYFGKAHSDSDILIHCPEQKILMTGDLFFPGGRPSIGNVDETDIARWQTAEKWIEERMDKIEIVIGGHGQVMNTNDLNSFLEYISEKTHE